MSTTVDVATARCEDMISTLVIPRPFSIDGFLTTLAEQRGKRIELMPSGPGSDQLCGMLIGTAEFDYIYCADNVSPLQWQHTVMHEVGHLVFDHCGSASDCGDVPRVAGADALRMLLPTLSPSLLQRILGRSTIYASDEEREAELFASLMLARISGNRDERLGLGPALSAGLAELESAFGHTVRGRRRRG